MHQVKVTQIGNSLGVVLPKEVVERLGIVRGQMLSLSETATAWSFRPSIRSSRSRCAWRKRSWIATAIRCANSPNDMALADASRRRTIHLRQIQRHGGGHGIRDEGLLESALGAPGESCRLWRADCLRLAASYAYGIARNHPFVDGNKRTAFVASVLFLRMNGQQFHAEQAEAAVVFLRLAAGEFSEAELAEWFRRNANPPADEFLCRSRTSRDAEARRRANSPMDARRDAMRAVRLPQGHPLVAAGRIGVLLVNLGTPEGTAYWPMRRYLGEFLSDRRVIETPRSIWQPILQGIMLSARPKKSGALYASIWNADRNESPLSTFTRAQAEKLAAELAGETALVVDWAMRYGRPSIAERLDMLGESWLRTDPALSALSAIQRRDDRDGERQGLRRAEDDALAAGAPHRPALP